MDELNLQGDESAFGREKCFVIQRKTWKKNSPQSCGILKKNVLFHQISFQIKEMKNACNLQLQNSVKFDEHILSPTI